MGPLCNRIELLGNRLKQVQKIKHALGERNGSSRIDRPHQETHAPETAAGLKECERVRTLSRVESSADTEPLSLDWRARVQHVSQTVGFATLGEANEISPLRVS
jgi:hypothetical protein